MITSLRCPHCGNPVPNPAADALAALIAAVAKFDKSGGLAGTGGEGQSLLRALQDARRAVERVAS